MLMVTTDTIPGKEWQPLGIVMGSMVQSKHIGKDIMSGLKTIVGGELAAYSEMMSEAREMATQRMLKEAEQLGADAVVCLRYTSASVVTGAAEILAFGTAVKYV